MRGYPLAIEERAIPAAQVAEDQPGWLVETRGNARMLAANDVILVRVEADGCRMGTPQDQLAMGAELHDVDLSRP